MKQKHSLWWLIGLVLVIAGTGQLVTSLLAGPGDDPPQEFITFQGFLKEDGVPANGLVNVFIRFLDAPIGGNQIGETLEFDGSPYSPVLVHDGFFMMQVPTPVPVYPDTFPPPGGLPPTHMEVGVQRTGDISTFPTIGLTPVPRAIEANVADDLRVPFTKTQQIDRPDAMFKLSTQGGTGAALDINTSVCSPQAGVWIENKCDGSALFADTRCNSPEAGIKVFNSGTGYGLFAKSDNDNSVRGIRVEVRKGANTREPVIVPAPADVGYAATGGDTFAAAMPPGLCPPDSLHRAVGKHNSATVAGVGPPTFPPPGSSLVVASTFDGDDIGGYGYSPCSLSLAGQSPDGTGVFGTTDSTDGNGGANPDATGVHGNSYAGIGVAGTTGTGIGVYGSAQGGGSDTWAAMFEAIGNDKVQGLRLTALNGPNPPPSYLVNPPVPAPQDVGFAATGGDSFAASVGPGDTAGTDPGLAVGFVSEGSDMGVWGYSHEDTGVRGQSPTGTGVLGTTELLSAGVVEGNINGPIGVHGISANGYAGRFDGAVQINGDLFVTGTKNFRIDHPLDPVHKYLTHYCTEGPKPLNIYNGNVDLDEQGKAWVELPAYFEALNRDFHYQLTCVGGFASVYIARKVQDNRFQIAGGTPGLTISWTVTGVRNDRHTQESGAPVETDKPTAIARREVEHADVE